MRIIITIVTLEYQRERERSRYNIPWKRIIGLHRIVVEMSDSESFNFAKCYCKMNIQL